MPAFKDALNDIPTRCFFPLSWCVIMTNLLLIRLTVAELERHKINMNTNEKHIIRSILKVKRYCMMPKSHFPCTFFCISLLVGKSCNHVTQGVVHVNTIDAMTGDDWRSVFTFPLRKESTLSLDQTDGYQ